jgi:hypothetical protein
MLALLLRDAKDVNSHVHPSIRIETSVGGSAVGLDIGRGILRRRDASCWECCYFILTHRVVYRLAELLDLD